MLSIAEDILERHKSMTSVYQQVVVEFDTPVRLPLSQTPCNGRWVRRGRSMRFQLTPGAVVSHSLPAPRLPPVRMRESVTATPSFNHLDITTVSYKNSSLKKS